MTSPTSQTPYLIRALHEWCSDNGLTPHIAVQVDDSVHVPREHVKEGQIVLNISWDATNTLQLGNECIEFRARFGGTLRDIVVPIGRVIAIYARETMQGLTFTPQDNPAPSTTRLSPVKTQKETEEDYLDIPPHWLRGGVTSSPPSPPKKGGGSGLKRVK